MTNEILQAVFCGQGSKAHNEQQASSNGSFANILMNGSDVFKFAVRAVPSVYPTLSLSFPLFGGVIL